MTQRVACFTGRFQPFHIQHLEVLIALSHKFERIIIGITNPDLDNLQAHNASQHRHTDEANPFSFDARRKIIQESLAGLKNSEVSNVEIEIVPFDLTSPQTWAVPAETEFALRIFSPWEASKLNLFSENGYKTLELMAPEKKISASDIRNSLSVNDDYWKSVVIPEAIPMIQAEWDVATALKVSV
jgi:nicotinamide mononucleotide adenylyltransferase